MGKRTVQIEGLRELDAALAQFKPETGKGVLRRVGKKRLEPLAASMSARAPDDPTTSGATDLKNINIGTKLSRRQARENKKMFKDDRASVELHVGPGPHAKGVQNEFGNFQMAAQSFARPAWQAEKDGILEGLKQDLWAEIAKTAARVAKRSTKGKG